MFIRSPDPFYLNLLQCSYLSENRESLGRTRQYIPFYGTFGPGWIETRMDGMRNYLASLQKSDAEIQIVILRLNLAELVISDNSLKSTT